MFYISGFYKFKKIKDTKTKKNYLQKYFLEYSIRGTLIISKEGINGTLSSKKKNLNSAILKIKKIFLKIALYTLQEQEEYLNQVSL